MIGFSVNCRQATEDNEHRARCGLALFGGYPSPSVCERCASRVPVNESQTAVTYLAISGPPAALPRDKWPAEATDLAACAIATDTGLGDVYRRERGDPDIGEKVKAWAAKISVGCGCVGNREPFLNRRYPLKPAG